MWVAVPLPVFSSFPVAGWALVSRNGVVVMFFVFSESDLLAQGECI
jgi:hypothetical protein